MLRDDRRRWSDPWDNSVASGTPCRDQLRERPRPRRRPPRRPGAGVPARPTAARAGTDPPLHAVDRRARRAFDMLCERSLSAITHGSTLVDKQSIQNWIADSRRADAGGAADDAARSVEDRTEVGAGGPVVDIAMIKYFGAPGPARRDRPGHPGRTARSATPPICRSSRCTAGARAARIYDGPDEVHRITVARQVLRGYEAPADEIPTEHIPTRREAARRQFASLLEAVTAND